jgi:predicted phosphodiesterase
VKIQLLSDLHLETQPEFVASPAPGADLLVLAGDVGSYQPNSRLPGPDFGLERFSPKLGTWPAPVLFVPGNHEYDNRDFDATHAQLRAACERLGITWLEREVLVTGGVRFIGCTLWSDFDALADAPRVAGEPPVNEDRRVKLRHKAFRAANYYLAKMSGTRHGRPLLAPEWRELGCQSRRWLEHALAQPFDGVTVVVTHFAPSLRSADPRYGVTPGTAGFCNSFDDLLPRAQYWLHGHLHCPQDYVHEGCRVVANPLGYAKRGEQEFFRPHFMLEIPVTADHS